MFAANFWVKNLGHNLLRDHLILTKISFFHWEIRPYFWTFFGYKNALMDTLTYSALGPSCSWKSFHDLAICIVCPECFWTWNPSTLVYPNPEIVSHKHQGDLWHSYSPGLSTHFGAADPWTMSSTVTVCVVKDFAVSPVSKFWIFWSFLSFCYLIQNVHNHT